MSGLLAREEENMNRHEAMQVLRPDEALGMDTDASGVAWWTGSDGRQIGKWESTGLLTMGEFFALTGSAALALGASPDMVSSWREAARADLDADGIGPWGMLAGGRAIEACWTLVDWWDRDAWSPKHRVENWRESIGRALL